MTAAEREEFETTGPPGAPMNTRVPLDDDYVKLVERAVYLFSYYEWAIIYVVERLEPGFVGEYCRKHWRGMTSGQHDTPLMAVPHGRRFNRWRRSTGY